MSSKKPDADQARDAILAVRSVADGAPTIHCMTPAELRAYAKRVMGVVSGLHAAAHRLRRMAGKNTTSGAAGAVHDTK